MDIPKQIADALYSPDTLAKIKAIADKYKLHIDVIGDIEAFVNLRIADKITDVELITDITVVVRDKDLAQKIIGEINTTIFDPLKASLIKATPAAEALKPVAPPVTQFPSMSTAMSGSVPVVPTTPPQPMLKEPEVPAVMANKPSILEIKMPATPASTAPAAPIAPATPPPQAPIRYHGTDPYREPPQ